MGGNPVAPREPGEWGQRAGDDGSGGEDGDSDSEPLNIAELVSELLYAGKTLAEVAGYDDVLLERVVCRKRDEYGRLVRHDSELPPWVEVDADGMRTISRPVPFARMFHAVKRYQGATVEHAEAAWKEYLKANPRLGRGGD